PLRAGESRRSFREAPSTWRDAAPRERYAHHERASRRAFVVVARRVARVRARGLRGLASDPASGQRWTPTAELPPRTVRHATGPSHAQRLGQGSLPAPSPPAPP